MYVYIYVCYSCTCIYLVSTQVPHSTQLYRIYLNEHTHTHTPSLPLSLPPSPLSPTLVYSCSCGSSLSSLSLNKAPLIIISLYNDDDSYALCTDIIVENIFTLSDTYTDFR